MYPSVKLHALMLTQKTADAKFLTKVTTGASSAPQTQGTRAKGGIVRFLMLMVTALQIIFTWVWKTIIIVAIQLVILETHGAIPLIRIYGGITVMFHIAEK